jgi:hypothetical protein
LIQIAHLRAGSETGAPAENEVLPGSGSHGSKKQSLPACIAAAFAGKIRLMFKIESFTL